MKPELNKPRDFLGYLAILPLTNNYKYSADSCIEVNNKKTYQLPCAKLARKATLKTQRKTLECMIYAN